MGHSCTGPEYLDLSVNITGTNAVPDLSSTDSNHNKQNYKKKRKLETIWLNFEVIEVVGPDFWNICIDLFCKLCRHFMQTEPTCRCPLYVNKFLASMSLKQIDCLVLFTAFNLS